LNIVGLEAQSFRELIRRLDGAAAAIESHRQVAVNFRDVGRNSQRLLILDDRVPRLSPAKQGVAEIVVGVSQTGRDP
jgi:orotate phosphoribosyltransferase-like protein